MRKTVFSLALGALMAPAILVAQDADKKVAGGGDLAPGWQMRIDPRAGGATPPKFVVAGTGFHATTGSRAIFWRPSDKGTGNYKVEATFTLIKVPAHAESYGLVFAGKDLTTPNQNYMYFTLGGNGSYLIKHRAGDEEAKIHTIANWTPSDAVAKANATGQSTDKLEVIVGPQKVQYLINGKEVYSQDRAALVGPGKMLSSTDGIAGIRVSHNLEVHIENFKVTPIK
jgi:hypothetical protein